MFYSKTFMGEFVPYYELFFKDKRFLKTTKEIANFIKNIAPSAKNILDFGCGSGIYSKNLAKLGFCCVGVDVSLDMINFAKSKNAHKNVSYFVGDIREFFIRDSFCACLMMSHVICYQVQQKDLIAVLKNTFNHLKKGGILLFDFYLQSGILKAGLEARIKQVQDKHIRITRFSNAKFCYLENAINLEYQYFIENNAKNIFLTSSDKMRFFSTMELEYYLKTIGFKSVRFFKSLSGGGGD
ncbi:MAG: class I SAM-dependent methyltransferase [Helicobacter sp.]|nr:class I SAM-dependent methyltransferase [Helicobacter sp.]